MNEINILDDKNDIYKFILLQMENYCINVIDGFDSLIVFEIIYFDGCKRNTINHELQCNYPIESIASISIKKFLEDETIDYMHSIRVNDSSVNSISGSVFSLIGITCGDSFMIVI